MYVGRGLICQVFLGPPTGTFSSTTNLACPSRNRHRPFLLHALATSVCLLSSHPHLPLLPGIFSVQCWAVFPSRNHHPSTWSSSSQSFPSLTPALLSWPMTGTHTTSSLAGWGHGFKMHIIRLHVSCHSVPQQCYQFDTLYSVCT